ncbi:MAG: DUF748 domain-containing protein [Rhodospirillales bacterium]|nr:DUF748 domain-containing protein [Rhodospirillales bacterium]
MTAASNPSEVSLTAGSSAAGNNGGQGPGRRRGRRIATIAAIVLGFLALIALLVLVAPRYVARYVANHYLAGMQIDVEGVKTIDIDIPRGEISIGPVRFHAGEADPGSVGRLGLTLSLRNLIERQALLESVVLSDLVVAIHQTGDGELIINGISLRQFLAEEAGEPAPKAENEAAPAAASGWGTGVDNLQARNVLVTFTNKDGGTAALTVQELDLRGFRSWEPNKPGSFSLVADVNGITVSATGEARPFAEKITTTSDITVDGIELQRIERFTGPLGLATSAGTVTLYAKSELALFPDSRIEGHTSTNVVLANVDVSKTDSGALKVDQGSVTVDGSFVVGENSDLSADGTVQAKLNEASGHAVGGASLALASAELGLADVAFRRTSDGAIDASARPDFFIERPAVSEPIRGNAEKIAVKASSLKFASTAEGAMTVRLDAGADGDGERLKIDLAKLALASPVEASADSIVLDVTALSADIAAIDATAPQRTTASAKATATLANASLRTAQEGAAAPIAASLAALKASLGELSLTLDGERLKMNVAPDIAAKQITVSLPQPGGGEQRIGADALDVTASPLSVEANAGRAAIAGNAEARLTSLSGALPAAGDAPAVEFAVGGAEAKLDELHLASSETGTKGGGKLNVAITDVASTWGSAPSPSPQPTARSRRAGAAPATPSAVPGGRAAAAKIAISASPFDLTQQPESTLFTTNATASLSKAQASVPAAAGEPAIEVSLENGEIALSDLGAAVKGDAVSLKAQGSSQLARFAARLPHVKDKPSADIGLDALRTRLDAVNVSQDPRGQTWDARADLQAEGISTIVEAGKLATLKMRTLSVGDVQVNSRKRIDIGRIVLDSLDVFASRAYLTGTAADDSRPKEAAETVTQASEQGWRFRLGSLGIANPAEIRLRDDSIVPNANFTVGVKALQVLNVDSGDPSQQATLRLEATINEFTDLALAGWAAPFGKAPSFDLNGRLQRLELPPLSPYAAQAIGVNVESGRLNLDVSATATQGKLNGNIDVGLRDLNFSALSPEDAARLSASVGVPIETVVGLLQDSQGRIKLKLPVSGELNSPSFDLSDAISQAVGGALQAAVLAPFQLAFAPVALIASVAGGGGMTFEPVPFEPNSSALNGTAKDMAAGLVRVLTERDKLSLKVCGRSTIQDLDAALVEAGAPASGPGRDKKAEELAGWLWSLAGERTANFRRALIDAGANARQVSECRTAYDPKDTKPPRVEVTL